MLLNMCDWEMLDVGCYMHKWRPELLVVRSELYANPAVRRCINKQQWQHIGLYVYQWALDTFPIVRDAGITAQDVRVVEGCHYGD